ncbi:MAG TPA: TolC family protein [Cyclobacteriaceae bacterium]|nr:TolC family protein [Cyclobacteriaceae bacterium]
MRGIISCLLVLGVLKISAQNNLTLQQAVEQARKNNLSIAAASSDVEAQRQMKKTGFDLPKTTAMLMYGQYNSFKNDNNITVMQSIPFTAFGSRAALNRSMLASSELKKATTENELVFQVKQVYTMLSYITARRQLLLQQDSIYEGFLKAASARYKAGEGKLLEQATAETQRNETKNQLMIVESDINVLRTQLKTLLNARELPTIENELSEIALKDLPDSTMVKLNPALAFQRQQVELASDQKKFEKALMAPDLVLGYFNQTLVDVINTENGSLASSADRFTGLQVGVAIPLWFVPYQGRIKSAEYKRQAAQQTYQYEHARAIGQFEEASQRYIKSRNSLQYYKDSALPNANLILRQAQTAFRGGDIGYTEYLLSVQNALAVKEGYLSTLNEYNQSIIYIEFLTGNRQ